MERFSPEWFAEKAKEQKYVNLQIEYEQKLREFQSLYGIEQLKALSGKTLLDNLFYNNTDQRENLC